MALNLSKFQFVNKIDFDKNIITKVNMVTNCQEILSKMLHDTELTDVILVAGIDGVRFVHVFCTRNAISIPYI